MSRELPPSKRPHRQPSPGPAGFTAYAVGKPYHPGVRSWPQGSQYNYRVGTNELILFFDRPTAREVLAVQSEPVEFALLVEPPLIFLCYRFLPTLPWSDAPYTWHRVPPDQRILPPPWEDVDPKVRDLIDIFLVDSSDGILRAARVVTLSPEFTRTLHRAIWEQAHAPYDPRVEQATQADVYRRYPDPGLMVRDAQARTQGGA